MPVDAQAIQEKAGGASTDDSKSSTRRRPLPDAPTGGATITASPRPALQRSTASLGKRRLSDNPNTEPLGKKRFLGLGNVQQSGEQSQTVDDEEMLLSNLPRSVSLDLSLPPPLPPRGRLKCTECECWGYYCSLENDPYAPSPCTSCEKRKRFCVEQRYTGPSPGLK